MIMKARSRSIVAGLMSGVVTAVGVTVLLATPSSAGDTARDSQRGGQEFSRAAIVVDSIEVAVFSEVVSIKTDALVDAEEPWPSIVLRRGFGPADAIFDWHRAIAQGQLSVRADFALVLYDDEGALVGRYWVEEGWPSRLKLSGSAVDTVTFTGSRVYRLADD